MSASSADPESGGDPRADPLDGLIERIRRGETIEAGDALECGDSLRDLLSVLRIIEEVGQDGPERVAASGPIEDDGPPPRRLGDYRIVREIGRGGMGIVYEAIEESLARRVALKVLPQNAVLDERRVERFRHEARVVASLQHPHIVPVYGVGEEDGVRYYAMQYIPGHPLHEVVRKLRRMGGAAERDDPDPPTLARSALSLVRTHVPDVDGPSGAGARSASSVATSSRGSRSTGRSVYFLNVARLGLQVTDALAHAHEAGVLHRDVKPSNLLLDVSGKIWIADFGLAKSLDDGGITRTGDVVGTLAYMAPERLRGWSDPRGDLYSLGVTLYELVTLRCPFETGDRARSIRSIVHQDPEPPSRLEPECPRDLETIILRLLEKEPARRYGSAQELASDLDAFLDDRPIRARRAGAVERSWRWARRNRGLAAALAVATTLLAVVAVSMGYARWQQDVARRSDAARQEASFWRLVHEAGEVRATRREGRRETSLARLRRASELLEGLDVEDGERDRRRAVLRTSLVAAMDCPDIVVARRLDVRADLGQQLAFDAGLSLVAWVRDEREAVVEDVDDGREVAVLELRFGGRARLDVSEDGSWLGAATRSERGATLEVFEVATSTRVLERPIAARTAFDLGASLVAWGTPDGSVELTPLAGGGVRGIDLGARAKVVALSPGDRRVAVVRIDGGIEVREVDSGAPPFVIPGWPEARVAWNPKGERLAITTPDAAVDVWDVSERERYSRCEGHRHLVMWPAFDRSGDLIATTSWDVTLRLWDAHTGRELLTTPVLSHGYPLRFGASGLLAYSRDRSHVVLWRPSVRPVRRSRSVEVAGDADIALGCGGRIIAIAGEDGVELVDAETVRTVARLGTGRTTRVAFSSDGVLTFSLSHGVHLWGLEVDASDEALSVSVREPRLITALSLRDVEGGAAIDLARNRLAFALGDRIVLVDLKSGERRVIPSPADRISKLAIDPAGRFLVTDTWGSSDNRVVDAQSGESLASLGEALYPAFSPDGRWLVGTSYTEVLFVDTATWNVAHRVPRSRETVPAPSVFSPDGDFLALVSSPDVVSLYSTPTVDGRPPRLLCRLESPEGGTVRRLRFSASGERLAVGRYGVLEAWDLGRIRGGLTQAGLDWGRIFATESSRLPLRVEVAGSVAPPAAAAVALELAVLGPR